MLAAFLGRQELTYSSYPLPPSCEQTEILRIVVRESLSGDLGRKLIADVLGVSALKVLTRRARTDSELGRRCS